VSEPTEFRSLLVVFDIVSPSKRKERYTVMLPYPNDTDASIYAYRKLILENKQKVRVKTHQLPNEFFLETSPFLFWDIWNVLR